MNHSIAMDGQLHEQTRQPPNNQTTPASHNRMDQPSKESTNAKALAARTARLAAMTTTPSHWLPPDVRGYVPRRAYKKYKAIGHTKKPCE
jgi:hypothetical protein